MIESRRVRFLGGTLLIGALAGLAAFGVAAMPSASAIVPFFGKYQGEAISNNDAEMSKRDLRVEIAPAKQGFTVSWVTITHKPSGKVKRKDYTITFQPSPRPGIYASAMRSNMFGQAVPLDPMRGDPYFWATIEDKVLIVHALIISDDGGYEMQVYERTLVEDGKLALKFSRLRDGKPLRTVTGELIRIVH